MNEPEIINFMEQQTSKLFDEVIRGMDICTCKRCRLDIIALALNNLPPKYVVTQRGEMFARLDSMGNQHVANIMSELTKSAAIISAKPNHD